MTTFLQATNAVLARLRDSSVASTSTSAYSSMIAQFVNDAKRQVEDAWNWDALQTSVTITTVNGTSLYTVTGSGRRQKDVTVNDSTNQLTLRNVPSSWITDQQQLTTTTTGSPCYYAWNGFNGTDSKMEFWPTPIGAYTIYVNMCVPQVDLTSDATEILVPAEPVILGAYARALNERGEDGGTASSEAYMLFKASLADYIAIEASRQMENDCWVAV